MLESVHIQNFRLFKEFHIDNLAHVADDRRFIGIVRDVDTDVISSWQSAKDRIERTNLGYQVPSNPQIGGVIIEAPNENLPRIGVWLMPDNQVIGELEDFVRLCIPSDNPLIPFADKILDEIENEQLHRYKEKRSKAFVYTWLAWQREPDIDMRKNFKQGTLSAETAIAQDFVSWLNQLFNPQS
ncbi:MAG: hypothetical protein GY796_19950 [Chloroflexi bacterium]|nr:hypothetical protein [Chloroflexota bacterium]